MTFYEQVYRVCEEKGTKPTIVLKELGMSTGNMSKWKGGTSPTVDVAVAIAHHLDVSLSYLCAPEDIERAELPSRFAEWVNVIETIPEDKWQMCLDFLRTHAVVPEKYANDSKGKRQIS